MSNELINFGKSRNNNFGFLRLFFAGLVIVSHSPELVDGNRSREILTQIFGTMSFGEIAVDGFFLISGYLITKSFIQSPTVLDYFLKRIFRVVPAYIVCFLICILCIAPFVGADISVLSIQNIKHGFVSMLRLLPPEIPGAFQGLHYPLLNGSMWTITYEFRCYIAVALFGLLSVYESRNRAIFASVVLILILLNATHAFYHFNIAGTNSVESLDRHVRFFAAFGVGACYFIFRDKVTFTWLRATIACVVLCTLMFSHRWAETAFLILGGYIIFWFAFKVPVLRLSRFDNGTDISYGLYLWAWPIQSLIIWNDRNINPWFLCATTFLLAGGIAYVSWILIEKPSLTLLKKMRLSTSRKENVETEAY